MVLTHQREKILMMIFIAFVNTAHSENSSTELAVDSFDVTTFPSPNNTNASTPLSSNMLLTQEDRMNVSSSGFSQTSADGIDHSFNDTRNENSRTEFAVDSFNVTTFPSPNNTDASTLSSSMLLTQEDSQTSADGIDHSFNDTRNEVSPVHNDSVTAHQSMDTSVYDNTSEAVTNGNVSFSNSTFNTTDFNSPGGGYGTNITARPTTSLFAVTHNHTSTVLSTETENPSTSQLHVFNTSEPTLLNTSVSDGSSERSSNPNSDNVTVPGNGTSNEDQNVTVTSEQHSSDSAISHSLAEQTTTKRPAKAIGSPLLAILIGSVIVIVIVVSIVTVKVYRSCKSSSAVSIQIDKDDTAHLPTKPDQPV